MIDVVRYAMQIDQFLAIFPRERMLLLTLDEFEQDPDTVLQRICSFLGVDAAFRFERVAERYNSGEAYEMAPTWARMATSQALRSIAYHMLPRAYRHRIRSFFARLPGRARDLGRYELTVEEQATLMSQLAPDLSRLEADYGVEVSKYWSPGVTGQTDD
jgi:hypothetical protein